MPKREDVPLADTCGFLRLMQQRRKFFIAAANKQTNAAGAYVRVRLGWSKDLPEAEARRVKADALAIVEPMLRAKPAPERLAEVASTVAVEMFAIEASIRPLRQFRGEAELEMKRAARCLPVAGWADGVRGFGELALAVVIGEAGDLSNYATVDRLWKRLGLAPQDGKAMSTWRRFGGLSAEEWSAAGYAPRRLAEIYACLTVPLFKHQTMSAGPYRAAYDRRRARTAETHADWISAHSHNDAMRVMTKSVISDLWSEWRRANRRVHESASGLLPAAEPIREAA